MINNKFFEREVKLAEKSGRGWVHAGEVPPCDVYIDGVMQINVRSVHRKKEKAVIYVTDENGLIVVNKYGKNARTRTAYGDIVLKQKLGVSRAVDVLLDDKASK